jgi:hypothetical protein
LKLEPKNKVACKIIENRSGKVRVKTFKKNSNKFRSNLRWVDIGVGSNNTIE